MKKNNHLIDSFSPIIHKQLIMYLKNLEVKNDTYVVRYVNKDNEFTFKSFKSNRRFLFDQKNVISTGLKLKSEKVILFKYSDNLKQNTLIKDMNTLISFRALLERFNMILENIYIFNSENLRAVKLKD